MAPVLLIKYAVSQCTADQVTRVFNQIFDAPVVDRVVVINKTNFSTGAPFHMFFIHLNDTPNESLDRFLKMFAETPVQKVVYNEPWFWNVVVAEPRPQRSTPTPYIKQDANVPDWMKDLTE
jgi:hypothetical protein